MRHLPATLLALALISAGAIGAAPQCDIARKKQVEITHELDGWLLRHKQDCTLCAGGTSCRDGFDRSDAARRRFEDWKKTHFCSGCGTDRCTAADLTLGVWTAEAGARHKEKCRKCELDAMRCDGWRIAQDEVRRRLEEWKRDHPALCDKCTPPCEDWKRRSSELLSRSDESVEKHKDRCANCSRTGICERPGLIKTEYQRDRLALWRKHASECPCSRRLAAGSKP